MDEDSKHIPNDDGSACGENPAEGEKEGEEEEFEPEILYPEVGDGESESEAAEPDGESEPEVPRPTFCTDAAKFYHSDIFSDTDRECIDNVFFEKLKRGEIIFRGKVGQARYSAKEFEIEIIAPEGGHAKALDAVAKLYHAQKCAFEDILTRDGFDIVSEIPCGYDGRIAALTANGTLIMAGKEGSAGRQMTSNRIYAVEELGYKSNRGYFSEDLRLGKRVIVVLIGRQKLLHSNARGLAINPRGAAGDELETMEYTTRMITTRTMELLSMPSEKIGVGGGEDLDLPEAPEKKSLD
ncbi:MAG: hypothetical protein E3J72_04125 [Planctomycetota bacterium]|nr:MAG: hypothetical protein E3J72_04125 [Planctomycetota bacterium]